MGYGVPIFSLFFHVLPSIKWWVWSISKTFFFFWVAYVITNKSFFWRENKLIKSIWKRSKIGSFKLWLASWQMLTFCFVIIFLFKFGHPGIQKKKGQKIKVAPGEWTLEWDRRSLSLSSLFFLLENYALLTYSLSEKHFVYLQFKNWHFIHLRLVLFFSRYSFLFSCINF